MNRYFLIPVSLFFFIIILLVLYFQYLDDEWKYFYKAKEKIIPKYCEDNTEDFENMIIKLDSDILENRNFDDQIDNSKNVIHLVYLVPCDVISRDLDINGKINIIVFNINTWFYQKSNNQKLKFDYDNLKLDITFMRTNKTLSWFNNFNSIQDAKNDNASKIEKIILANKKRFKNFESKKFIVFFEGWEKRKGFNSTCGRARFDGQVAIYYTNTNIKNKGSCVNIIDTSSGTLGNEEQTVLHELLHLMGYPNKCSKNIDLKNLLHVNDSKEDILYKFSGGKYLDYNNDDYYNHDNKECSDLKDSKYLF